MAETLPTMFGTVDYGGGRSLINQSNRLGVTTGAPSPLSLAMPETPSSGSGIAPGTFTAAGTLIAPGVGTVIGAGLDVINGIYNIYDRFTARKEAKEANAQARRDYEKALAEDAKRWEAEYALQLVQNKNNTKTTDANIENSRLQRKDNLRVEAMNIMSGKVNKWLSMLNDPTQKSRFSAIMRGAV